MTRKWYEVMLLTYEKGVPTLINENGDTSWDAHEFETREEADAVAKEVAKSLYETKFVEVQEWTSDDNEINTYKIIATYEGERFPTSIVYSQDDECEAKAVFSGDCLEVLSFYEKHRETATYWSEKKDRSTYRNLTYSYQDWWIEDENGETQASARCVRIYEPRPSLPEWYDSEGAFREAQQDWEDEVAKIMDETMADYVVAER